MSLFTKTSATTNALIINVICLALFIIDRLLKYVAISLYSEKSIKLLGFLLKFDFYSNKGIAFSIQFKQIIIIILIILIISAICWFLYKSYKIKKWLYIFCLSLILIGSVSNLIDRLIYGYVIDYFDMRWFTVFNLADVMIVIGALILIISNIDLSKKKEAR